MFDIQGNPIAIMVNKKSLDSENLLFRAFCGRCKNIWGLKTDSPLHIALIELFVFEQDVKNHECSCK
jgi:hypothetical protein